jgi:arabinosyltransferase C
MPCQRPPRVVDGMVEPVTWVVQSQTFANAPPLAFIDGGGSYALLPEVGVATVYPGFTPGAAEESWGSTTARWGNLVRFDPALPTDGFRLVPGSRVIPGWTWWPGAGPGPSPDVRTGNEQ